MKGRTTWAREWLQMLVLALVISVVLRSFAFEIFKIPSGSMIPTLLKGDYVFVVKYSYGFGRYSLPFGVIPFQGRVWFKPPKRGDVAVFRHPRQRDTDYIKRVVGLPGDTVQVRGGVLFVNNTPVNRVPLASSSPYHRYTETLPGGGRSYNIQEIFADQGRSDNTPAFTVPARHYFMMGDNRDNSVDSRYIHDVGMISEDLLIGQAAFVIYSFQPESAVWMFWNWWKSLRGERSFLLL